MEFIYLVVINQTCLVHLEGIYNKATYKRLCINPIRTNLEYTRAEIMDHVC